MELTATFEEGNYWDFWSDRHRVYQCIVCILANFFGTLHADCCKQADFLTERPFNKVLLHCSPPKQNLRHNRRGIVWVESVTTTKLMDYPYSYIKGNSVLMACWANMPYACCMGRTLCNIFLSLYIDTLRTVNTRKR